MSKEAKLIFICVYLLVGLGVVMTYSASAVYAEYLYRNPQHFLVRQIIYACLGTIFLFIAASVPISFWKKQARALMLLAIVFLIMVYVPMIGRSAGGARRWIGAGPINFQPAELAKLTVCIYLADYLTRKRKYIHQGSLGVFVPPVLLVGMVCVLAILQPDLGSCAFIFLMAALLFFLAGIKMRYILSAALIFLPIFYFLVMRVPYRLSRVTAYLNPWQDPHGSGFQIIQSMIAYALGGWKGVGLGQSTQKLFYLPSSYNDFIFSIIAEELGMLGLVSVMMLYVVILVCGIRMTEKAHSDHERFLIYSLILLISVQAIIHMLVATGLVPTKGLPLPFVSYGGTSIVMNLTAVGILMGIGRQKLSRR